MNESILETMFSEYLANVGHSHFEEADELEKLLEGLPHNQREAVHSAVNMLCYHHEHRGYLAGAGDIFQLAKELSVGGGRNGIIIF